MKLIFNPLYQALEQELMRLHAEADTLLFVSEQALILITKCLEKIKEALKHHRFENEAEEIDFFRNRKPLLTSKLIYYNTLYLIESCRPVGDKKTIKAYYRTHLQKLERFFNDNIEFYRYYRSGNHHLDALYFKRGVTLAVPLPENFHFEHDPSLGTTHDYKVACILANDELQHYLEEALVKTGWEGPAEKPFLKWTAPKIGLVELIYALHTQGVFNNGKALLKDICKSIEGVFQVELGHIPRHYMELRERKTTPTRFLDDLAENLLHRMAESDR